MLDSTEKPRLQGSRDEKTGFREPGFLFNGGVLTPFGFESSTSTIVLLQIIALKTTKSKFYVATPCTALISALGMVSIIVTKVPY